jgi:hypothetical protein
LRLANRIAVELGETVAKYGDETGTHGADVVSVNAKGEVTLWDSKFHSDSSVVQRSDTFEGAPMAKAIEDARTAIDESTKLTPEQKLIAKRNLKDGNFTAITSSTDHSGRWIDRTMIVRNFEPQGGH